RADAVGHAGVPRSNGAQPSLRCQLYGPGVAMTGGTHGAQLVPGEGELLAVGTVPGALQILKRGRGGHATQFLSRLHARTVEPGKERLAAGAVDLDRRPGGGVGRGRWRGV